MRTTCASTSQLWISGWLMSNRVTGSPGQTRLFCCRPGPGPGPGHAPKSWPGTRPGPGEKGRVLTRWPGYPCATLVRITSVLTLAIFLYELSSTHFAVFVTICVFSLHYVRPRYACIVDSYFCDTINTFYSILFYSILFLCKTLSQPKSMTSTWMTTF